MKHQQAKRKLNLKSDLRKFESSSCFQNKKQIMTITKQRNCKESRQNKENCCKHCFFLDIVQDNDGDCLFIPFSLWPSLTKEMKVAKKNSK